jgi:hypothetical protein
MIFFLSGENTYDERAALDGAQSYFFKKTKTSEAATTFDAAEDSFAVIEEALLTDTLFGAPRCVVVRGLVAAQGDAALSWFRSHKDSLKRSHNLFIFVERSLQKDVQEKTLQFFEANADKVRDAVFLDSAALDRWLQTEAKKRDVAMSSFERSALIDSCDGSQWALLQEIERRALGGVGSTTKSGRPDEKASFALMDDLMRSRCAHPLACIASMRAKSVTPEQFIFTFLWRLKTILLAHRGATKKLNPYVAKKAAEDTHTVSFSQAADLFWKGVQIDSEMKRDSAHAEDIFLSLLYDMRGTLAHTQK